MSSNGHLFVEWKEEFVSQERGNRKVHYFLKDSAGESILAVVGTERSLRHMFYVVADEFLQVCGTENSIHAGFKWRSRREVVDWLTSMLSKQHLDRSKSPKNDSTPALGSPKFSKTGSGARRTRMPDYAGRLARNLKGHDSDIVWSGVAWTCGKQLKHFRAFCRNGTTIAIQSFVFVMAKEEDHYLAYLEDMYEDRKLQKKVKVRWFHYNQEVKGVIPLQNPHPKEVFITPCAQVISAECVDGPAIVLTPEHYEKCLATFPHAWLARVHLCCRQFRNNRVKPFDLSKLHGYFDQAIFSCLDPNPSPKSNSICHRLAEEQDEEFSPGDDVKKGAKRTRSCRGRQRIVTDRSGASISGRGRQMLTYEPPYKNFKYGLSGRRLLFLKNSEPQPWHIPPFKVDDKIELLCQDSGIRGCWFRCTVLEVSRKQMKVQYDDVQDEDGCGNLKECIPVFRLAMPDKLGMRWRGRPIVRPTPPPSNQTDLAFEVGATVDAWWSDGWWEGVVTAVDNCGEDSLQVYFPGENLHMNVHKTNLRISREWVRDQWVDIDAKPDILSAISAAISPDAKLSTSSAIAKDPISDGFAISYQEVPTSTKLDIVEEDKHNLASSDGLPKDRDGGNDKKQPSLNDEGSGDDTNDSQDRDNVDDDVRGTNDDDVRGTNDDDDDIDTGDDSDDDVGDNDDDGGKLRREEFETARQKCEVAELMEVVA